MLQSRHSNSRPGLGFSVATRSQWLLLLVALPTLAWSAPPAFRRHVLNAESEFPACAVIDVNGDGKLDVVSGGWWYEAPTWTKHFVREVEVIRGRYDDYSNLPLDVNGDGFIDIISVNYRSEKIYWIQHPGKSLGPWKTHEVAKPGPSETGRLIDIDGDGRLDIVPNGRDFVAWWELLPATGNKAATVGRGFVTGEVKWARHELPQELVGHGVGAGDVNGDGRLDMIGPNGWAEAPPDRRKERWLWHADFRLHRDASIPILCFDVDGDRDNDIVYARGHGFGLYWLEQVGTFSRDAQRSAAASTSNQSKWQLHTIDTQWSQSHAIEMADLDNDGTPELIAGKRHLGHDGKDLGEWDPAWIAVYAFDKQLRSWQRRVISFGGQACLGLDPKVADLDHDGDLDLVAADRSGLFWFENLHIDKQLQAAISIQARRASECIAPDPLACASCLYCDAQAREDHARLLLYRDEKGNEQPVKDAATWGLKRQHILEGMQQAMGELPDSSRRVPLDVQVLEETPASKYLRKKITFASEPGDRVPAYLLVPTELRGPAPAMLCLHQTTKIGKGEPAGLGGLPNLHYAHELAERGFVCIVPDYPSFGDYAFDFKAASGRYASGTMKAIWNNHRAVDLLESLAEVDRDKIGVIGHSLGGHNALFTAAFDQRLKAVVTSCGFTAFHDYYGGKLAGWTSDRYMPRLRDRYHNSPDEAPFDFHGVLATIAPRGIFVNAPVGDDNFAVAGVKKVEASAGEVFSLLGAKQKLVCVYPEAKHDFPIEIRKQAYDWLKTTMK